MTQKEIVDIISNEFEKHYGKIMLDPFPKTRNGDIVKLTKAQKEILEVCRVNDESAYLIREQQLIAFVLDFVSAVNGTDHNPTNTLHFN